jgi:hypothetical protein
MRKACFNSYNLKRLPKWRETECWDRLVCCWIETRAARTNKVLDAEGEPTDRFCLCSAGPIASSTLHV